MKVGEVVSLGIEKSPRGNLGFGRDPHPPGRPARVASEQDTVLDVPVARLAGMHLPTRESLPLKSDTKPSVVAAPKSFTRVSAMLAGRIGEGVARGPILGRRGAGRAGNAAVGVRFICRGFLAP